MLYGVPLDFRRGLEVVRAEWQSLGEVMTPTALRGIGIACLVLSAVLFYVGYERYQTNANNVNAINQFTQSAPFGPMMGQSGQLEPATPAATKYAVVFALLSAAGGVVSLVAAQRGEQRPPG